MFRDGGACYFEALLWVKTDQVKEEGQLKGRGRQGTQSSSLSDRETLSRPFPTGFATEVACKENGSG